MQTLYVDLITRLISTSLGSFVAPVLRGVQGSALDYDIAFHTAGVIAPLATSAEGRLTLQLAGVPQGEPLRVIGDVWTPHGSGTSARYTARLVADNAPMRGDFAGVDAAQNYWLQLKWSEPGQAVPHRSQRFAVAIDPANDIPNSTTPNPLDELADPDLYVGNRALRYDVAQSLSSGQQEVALSNLGLSNSFANRPGVIVVNETLVAGVRTAPTLQAAFDEMTALGAENQFHTIEIYSTATQASTVADDFVLPFPVNLLTISGGTITGLDLTGCTGLTSLKLRDTSLGRLDVTPPTSPAGIDGYGAYIGEVHFAAGMDVGIQMLLSGSLRILAWFGDAPARTGTGGAEGYYGIGFATTGPVWIESATCKGGAGQAYGTGTGNGGAGGLGGIIYTGLLGVVVVDANGRKGGAGGTAGTTGGSAGTNNTAVTTAETHHALSSFTQL